MQTILISLAKPLGCLADDLSSLHSSPTTFHFALPGHTCVDTKLDDFAARFWDHILIRIHVSTFDVQHPMPLVVRRPANPSVGTYAFRGVKSYSIQLPIAKAVYLVP